MRSLKGTKRLLRLAIRRDRIVIPVTILLILMMVGGSAPALVSTYPDQASQLTYVASSAPSVVGRMFQGTVQGANLGSIMMAEVYLFTAVIMAIMSAFIISRHTRHNEETGAGELIASAEVGRNAALSAALVVAVGANALASLLMFLMLLAVQELDATGSLLLSVSLGMVGVFFAGVAAITAQLSDYRRGANTMSISIIGILFLVRGFGDALGDISADGLSVTASWLTWLSPFGWGYQVLPYTQDRLYPLVLLAIGSVAAAGFGYYLSNVRDVGSSIFEAKPGPKRAKASLLRSGGLTRKLQRSGLVAWLLGFVVVGILYGVMVNDYRSLFEESEVFQEILASTGSTGNFSDAIFAAMITLTASLGAGFAVSALSKMQDEESSGRLEYLLGTALSRLKWVSNHIVFVVFGSALIMGAMGLSSGLTYHIASDNPDTTIAKVFVAGLVNVPAMIVFMSAIVFVFGVFGKFVRAFAWSFFAFCALIPPLSGIFNWPQMLLNFSPFEHTPPYPSESLNMQPIWILLAVGLTITAAGIYAFTRRDIVLK